MVYATMTCVAVLLLTRNSPYANAKLRVPPNPPFRNTPPLETKIPQTPFLAEIFSFLYLREFCQTTITNFRDR
jgi:hypothetical protein